MCEILISWFGEDYNITASSDLKAIKKRVWKKVGKSNDVKYIHRENILPAILVLDIYDDDENDKLCTTVITDA